MLTHINDNSFKSLYLDTIIDYIKDSDAVDIKDKYFIDKDNKYHLQKTTKGLKLKVQ